MTQTEQLNKEMAKALMEYYSWHMDELLKLYNAMGQTNEQDASKLHLEIDGDRVYFWVEGLHIYFIKL